LVEGGIEGYDLRDIGKNVCDGVDAEEVRRVVQGGEVAAVFDLLEDVIVDEGASGEEICTLDYTVADGFYVREGFEDAEFRVYEGVHDELHADHVVWDGEVAGEAFLAGGAVLDGALGEADLFYQTFGKKVVHIVALHVKELILDGGAAAIDYQDDHMCYQ
jgi:hypothetical protein